MAGTDYITQDQLDTVVADVNARVLKLAGGDLTGHISGPGLTMTGTAAVRDVRTSRQNEPTLTSTLHAIQIGADGLANLALGPSRIQARNNGAAGPLNLNANGGPVTINGAESWHAGNFEPAIAYVNSQGQMAASVDPVKYPIVVTEYKRTQGDLAGGTFVWDASLTAADFAFDNFQGVYVESVHPNAPAGGYRRQYDGPVYADWFLSSTLPGREISRACLFSRDVKLHARTYFQDTEIKLQLSASLVGAGKGVTVIRSTGGTGPVIGSLDPTVALQNVNMGGFLIQNRSPRDYVIDFPGLVSCEFFDIRITTDDLTTGGFQSVKIGGLSSWIVSMTNVQVRLLDGSAGLAYNCEFGDSDMVGCTGTGGDSVFQPTGGLRFIGGRFDRADIPLTMKKNPNTNSSVSFKGTQFEEFTTAGIKFLVEAGTTGTSFAFSMVGSNFRAGGNTPTADIVLENNGTEEMIGGTLNAAHTVSSVSPIAYEGTGTWRDVIFAPEHLANPNSEPTKFAGTHSVISSRGMRTEGPIIPGTFTTAQLSAANGNASLFPSRSSGGIVILDNGINGALAYSYNNRWRTGAGAVI